MFSLVQQLQGVQPFPITGGRLVNLLPPDEYTRICTNCGEEKADTEFYKGHSMCRECFATQCKKRYIDGGNTSEATKKTVLESLNAGNTSATAIHLDTGLNAKTVRFAIKHLEQSGQIKSLGTRPARYVVV